MAFVQVPDLKEADKLWEAKLLWWDGWNGIQPCQYSDASSDDYYKPSVYAVTGGAPYARYYILLED